MNSERRRQNPSPAEKTAKTGDIQTYTQDSTSIWFSKRCAKGGFTDHNNFNEMGSGDMETGLATQFLET
jgi:hypothetical protein